VVEGRGQGVHREDRLSHPGRTDAVNPVLVNRYIHGAWQEITEKLEWAMVYLSKNGKKSRQRKSKQNNTLDGIINSLAA
jgi:hypothetical protein